MNFEFPTSLIGENEFTYCIFLTQNRVILMSKTWIFDFNIWVGERERVFISNKLLWICHNIICQTVFSD